MKYLVFMILLAMPLASAQGQKPAPTPESVLQALKQAASESPGSRSAIDGAADLLRQAHGRYTEEELDAFANELEQIILAGVEPLATDAARVLVHSATEFSYGIPYVNAANVLARVYESYRDSHPKGNEARSALRRVYRAQGQAYVIGLFLSSERPTLPCIDGDTLLDSETESALPERLCSTVKYQSEWCRAAHVLLFDRDGPPAEAPDYAQFAHYCGELRVRHYTDSFSDQ